MAPVAFSRKAAMVLFKENCPVALRNELVYIASYWHSGTEEISPKSLDKDLRDYGV